MTFIARAFNHGPRDRVSVNQDDSPVTLEYGRLYVIDNDGAAPSGNTQVNLPAITQGDLGRPIYLLTCYTNDPNDTDNFGHGLVKRNGSDQINVTCANESELELYVQDDALILYHDGVSTWYLGN